MTSRERVIRTIEFKEPDRVPLWPRFEDTAWIQHGRALYDLVTRYPIDIGRPDTVPQFQHQPLTWTDEWGCGWKRERQGFFGTVLQHPLTDPDDLRSYEFPDYSRPEYDKRFAQMVERFAHRSHDDYVIVNGADDYGVFWYRMWWLRGMDNAMVDTAGDDGFVQELRDRILKTQLSHVRRVLEADVDGVCFGDDWGTQSALMISPERWRAIFKPAYKQLFDAVHEAGKHVIFETDGCVTPILEDWVEVGVDVLSVQLNVVGLENVARLRGRMCFLSDPDRQDILHNGSPQEVEAHIHDIVRALKAPNGGLLGCLYVTESVPLANVEATLDAFIRYGRYGEDEA